MTSAPNVSLTLIILPGWALGPAPLAPLKQALIQQLPNWSIECPAYPALTSHHPEVWLDALDARLPDHAWLAGWSLGGMLAAALAERRGARTPGLITLGANASFVTRPSWASAMATHTFDDFRTRMRQSPQAGFARFAALGAQGSRDARSLGRTLLSSLRKTPTDEAVAGLATLHALDLRDVLPRLSIPQLHLFGEHDVLVPAGARQAMAEHLPPSGETQLLPDTGHGFPIEQAESTAKRMTAFIQRNTSLPYHDC